MAVLYLSLISTDFSSKKFKTKDVGKTVMGDDIRASVLAALYVLFSLSYCKT